MSRALPPHARSVIAFLALGLLVLTGSIAVRPHQRSHPPHAPRAQQQRPGMDKEMLDLAAQIPGFGGLYVSVPTTADGRPDNRAPVRVFVYLTSGGDSA